MNDDTLFLPPLPVERGALAAVLRGHWPEHASSLRPEFFSTPERQKIFVATTAQPGVDALTVQQMLTNDPETLMELAEVVSADPPSSDAGADHYIDMLADAAHRRQLARALHAEAPIIRAAERIVQDDADRDAGQAFFPSWGDPVPADSASLLLNGERIVSPGNLCLVLAGVGTGKTSVAGAIAAARLNPTADTFGLSIPVAGPCLYLNTEESTADVILLWRRIMRRAMIHEGVPTPDLIFTGLKAVPSVARRRAVLWSLCRKNQPALVVLDGLADFVRDVNDPGESSEFLYELLARADAGGFGVVATLHSNFRGDSKARGHLGSEALRRAETVFQVRYDKKSDCRALHQDFEYGKARHTAATLESWFTWDPKAAMMKSCDKPEMTGRKLASEGDRADTVAALAGEHEVWSYTAMVKRAAELRKIKPDAAKAWMRRAKTSGLIVQTPDGFYRPIVEK